MLTQPESLTAMTASARANVIASFDVVVALVVVVTDAP
jgi:hypothetical protein